MHEPIGLPVLLLVLLGLVILLIAKLVDAGYRSLTSRRCPYCRERVRRRAVVCPHCRGTLAERGG